MTMPPEPDEQQKSEVQKVLRQNKRELLESKAPTAIAQILAGLMERYESVRTRLGDPDDSLLELLLCLVRNLLAVEEDPKETECTATWTPRDRLIERLIDEGILDMVALAAGESKRPPFRDETSLFAELYHHLFRGTSPTSLATALSLDVPSSSSSSSSKRKRAQSECSEEAFRNIKTAMQATKLPPAGNRPRMCGAFVRQGEGATGSAVVTSAPWNAPRMSGGNKGAPAGRSKPRLNGAQQEVRRDEARLASDRARKLLGQHVKQMLASNTMNALATQLADDLHHGRESGMTSTEVRLRKIHSFYVVAFCVGFRLEKWRREGQGETGLALGGVAECLGARMVSTVAREWQRAASEKDWGLVEASAGALHRSLEALASARRSPWSKRDRATALSIAANALAGGSGGKAGEGEAKAGEGVLEGLQWCLKRFDPRKQPRSHCATTVCALRWARELLPAARGGKEAEAAERKLFEPQAIVNHAWLLKSCVNNAKEVNEAAANFLSRTNDLGYEPMLYQLSLLRLAHSIATSKACADCDNCSPALQFARSLAKSFAAKLRDGPPGASAMLFVDCLWWRSRHKAAALEMDFRERNREGETKTSDTKRGLLNDEEVEELAELWSRHARKPECFESIAAEHSASITPSQARYQLRKLGLSKLSRSKRSRREGEALDNDADDGAELQHHEEEKENNPRHQEGYLENKPAPAHRQQKTVIDSSSDDGE